jgi:DNA-binding transcriptional LysR family regulator
MLLSIEAYPFRDGATMQASDRIGRRMKLHDLHVLMAVAQFGSMGKAARHLNTSQSAISRSIGELEHALGVRLFDRSRQGIEPTQCGRALLGCGAAVFDELSQGVKRIEFLNNPTVGEVRVAGNEHIIAGVIATVFGRLRGQYPGIAIDVASVVMSEQHRELRERKVDLVVGRVPPSDEADIHSEILFHDGIVIVAGLQSRWSRRRKVDLSELVDEPWVFPQPQSPFNGPIADLFRARGLQFPPKGVARGSVHLLCALVASGPFVGIFPGSLLRFSTNLPPLKVLPVELPIAPLPFGIMTLKNRTISPVAQLFIDCTREITKPLARRGLLRAGR